MLPFCFGTDEVDTPSMGIRGAMAEWLCSGLQSRVPQFDSGFRLQRFLPINKMVRLHNQFFLILQIILSKINRIYAAKNPRGTF